MAKNTKKPAEIEKPADPAPVTDPAPMELVVLESSVTFRWNFADIKAELQRRLEKYSGLVVTEDNLKEMEQTTRDIASLRVQANNFRIQTKKQLAEPADKFDGEVKELLDLIRSAEAPLREQILKYEAERVTRRSAELSEFADATAASMGIRPEYKYQVPIALANRSMSDKAAKERIVSDLDATLKRQEADDVAKETAAKAEQARVEAIRQASAMLIVTCKSMSELAGLTTPISAGEIAAKIPADASPEQISQAIMAAVAERKAVEQAAAAKVQEPVQAPAPQPDPPPPAPPVGPPLQNPQVDMITVYDLQLEFKAMTMAQLVTLRKAIDGAGIPFTVLNKREYEVPTW